MSRLRDYQPSIISAMIQQTLEDGARFGLRIEYSHMAVILGTGGGIKEVESPRQDS
ncbi:hypothetical protein [Nitrospira sp. Nam80]